ncbi:putative membrane protein [Helicobacter pylori Hp M2]|nr:putative membrane protein [Helicobacter pylori Hp M2]EJC60701.1 putative membrane protein [Helicobacter pylori Hp M9]
MICNLIVFFFFFKTKMVSLFYGTILDFNKKAFGKKGA